MNWKGKWRNQYGSTVDITDDANHRIAGMFKTALEDSGFYGKEVPVVGIHQGDCISFVAGGKTPAVRGRGFRDQGAARRRARQNRKTELVALDHHQRRYV